MTGPTSEGIAYVACSAVRISEKEKTELKAEKNNGAFKIVSGMETTISVKPGAPKELLESPEYKRYNKNKNKMVEKFTKGKAKKQKENSNESER